MLTHSLLVNYLDLPVRVYLLTLNSIFSIPHAGKSLAVLKFLAVVVSELVQLNLDNSRTMSA